jgi:hypothetical protein
MAAVTTGEAYEAMDWGLGQGRGARVSRYCSAIRPSHRVPCIPGRNALESSTRWSDTQSLLYRKTRPDGIVGRLSVGS